MPSHTDAFAALERLDHDGRKALALCTTLLRQRLHEATERAEKAEFLLTCVLKWSNDWGLCFSLETAEADWRRSRQRRTNLVATFEPEIEATIRELRELRGRLNEALEGRERAEIRAERAEARLSRLRRQVLGRQQEPAR